MARCEHSYSRQIPPPICWRTTPQKLSAVADGLHKHFACSSKVPLLAPDSGSCSRAQVSQALGWSLLLQDLSDCTDLPYAGRFITLKNNQPICFFLSLHCRNPPFEPWARLRKTQLACVYSSQARHKIIEQLCQDAPATLLTIVKSGKKQQVNLSHPSHDSVPN
jgi:hypothetical protein